jgi:hypothetical protein
VRGDEFSAGLVSAMADHNMSMNIEGWMDLSERAEQDADGFWNSTDLVEADVGGDDNVSLSFSFEEKEECLTVGLSAHHIENPETKRVFHGHLTAYLDTAEVKLLHGYLGFLLQHVLTEK